MMSNIQIAHKTDEEKNRIAELYESSNPELLLRNLGEFPRLDVHALLERLIRSGRHKVVASNLGSIPHEEHEFLITKFLASGHFDDLIPSFHHVANYSETNAIALIRAGYEKIVFAALRKIEFQDEGSFIDYAIQHGRGNMIVENLGLFPNIDPAGLADKFLDGKDSLAILAMSEYLPSFSDLDIDKYLVKLWLTGNASCYELRTSLHQAFSAIVDSIGKDSDRVFDCGSIGSGQRVRAILIPPIENDYVAPRLFVVAGQGCQILHGNHMNVLEKIVRDVTSANVPQWHRQNPSLEVLDNWKASVLEAVESMQTHYSPMLELL